MIDYEKLAEAHNLADKLAKKSGRHIELLVSYYESASSDYGYTIYNHDESYDNDEFESLDKLIEKLKELILSMQILNVY